MDKKQVVNTSTKATNDRKYLNQSNKETITDISNNLPRGKNSPLSSVVIVMDINNELIQ